MRMPIALIAMLLCLGIVLLCSRLRAVILIFLAAVGVLYGISRWLIAGAPTVRGCAYLCSRREDAGVWLLFACIALLVGGSLLLAGGALAQDLLRQARARRRR
jgi:hypothetical protein